MYLIARRSFSVGRRIIHRGQIVDADDPIIAGRECLFAAPDDVETATRRPGEKSRAKAPETPEPDPIPRKADEVVAWIGDDAARAAQALEAEQAAKSPRKSVIEAAEAVLAAAQAPADPSGDGEGTGEPDGSQTPAE